MGSEGTGEADFRRFYERHYAAIYRFIALRVPDAAARGDLVSEVFVTSWRRRDDVPAPPQDRPWLFGVAKYTLATYRRTETRRSRLVHRLAAQPAFETSVPSHPGPALEAFSRLRATDQEALRLVVWDELSVGEAATVMGCSVSAMNVRLHRARRRLVAEMGDAGGKAQGQRARAHVSEEKPR